MISVNPKYRKDPSQRYKMPMFELRVQGKNQNTKTCLENLEEIAEKLSRPAPTIHRFFGLLLNTRLDEKAGKYYLRGNYKHDTLQPGLDTYIMEYVLCKHCGNPETVLTLDPEKKVIYRDCGACGNRSDVEGDKKMIAIFVKGGYVKVADDPADATKKKKKKKKKKKAAEEEEDDGIEWTVDTSKEAKEKRRAELLGKTSEQELETLVKMVELAAEAYLELQKKESWSTTHLASLLVEKAFDSSVYTQLDQYAPLLTKLAAGNEEFQLGMINGVANLCCATYPHLEKSLAAIFQKMYNIDVAEEDAFVKWFATEDAKTESARSTTKPFYEWLTSEE